MDFEKQYQMLRSQKTPYAPQYSEMLMRLSAQAKQETQYWQERLGREDPSYKLPPEHWHPRDLKPKERSEPEVEVAADDTLQKKNIVFSPAPTAAKAMAHDVRDDASTTSSVSEKGGCHLCASSEKCHKHAHKKVTYRRTPYRVPPSYTAPPPTVAIKEEEDNYVECREVSWKVTVKTAAASDAGTTAKAYVQLEGSRDTTKKWALTKKAHNFYFGRGRSETFFFVGPDIGEPRKLLIEHTGTEKKDAWLVEEVTLTHVAVRRTWHFTCGKWMSEFIGDKQNYRLLRAEEIEPDVHEYEVTMVTGDRAMAATASPVYLTLYGREGVSPRLHMREGAGQRKPFQRGQVDKFLVELDSSVGSLSKIRVATDGKEDWFLRLVVVKDVGTGQRVMYVCNDWLPTENNSSWRELLGQKVTDREDEVLKDVLTEESVTESSEGDSEYVVLIETGDKSMAGTDSTVFLQLFGKAGRTNTQYFKDKKGELYEKNSIDKFEFTSDNVGGLTKIRIGHDGSGKFAGWFLERVVVRKILSEEEKAHGGSRRPGELMIVRPPRGFSAPVGMVRRKEEAERMKREGEEKRRVMEAEDRRKEKDLKKAKRRKGVGLSSSSSSSEDSDDDERTKLGSSLDRSDRLERAERKLREKQKQKKGAKGRGLRDEPDRERRRDRESPKRAAAGVEYVFHVHRWFAKDEDDGVMVREIPVTYRRNVYSTRDLHSKETREKFREDDDSDDIRRRPGGDREKTRGKASRETKTGLFSDRDKVSSNRSTNFDIFSSNKERNSPDRSTTRPSSSKRPTSATSSRSTASASSSSSRSSDRATLNKTREKDDTYRGKYEKTLEKDDTYRGKNEKTLEKDDTYRGKYEKSREKDEKLDRKSTSPRSGGSPRDVSPRSGTDKKPSYLDHLFAKGRLDEPIGLKSDRPQSPSGSRGGSPRSSVLAESGEFRPRTDSLQSILKNAEARGGVSPDTDSRRVSFRSSRTRKD